MHREFYSFGNFTIYWYGVLVALGFLAAILHWSLLARKERYPPGFGSDMGFWIILSGILGARTAYILANWSDYWEAPWTIFRIDQGGLIFYGGFIGAILGVILFAKIKKRPVWAVGDLAVGALPLGHALGRIGCFLNGCCFGRPTECAWGVYMADAVRHPTQLYEALYNLLLYGFLLWAYPRRKRDGNIFALYLLLYPPARFLIEFLRGDERKLWAGFHAAQLLSMLLFAVGCLLWFAGRKRPVRLKSHMADFEP